MRTNKKKYARDKDGFVKIQFLDSNDEETEFEFTRKPKDLGPGFTISKEYKFLADEGKLTQEILLNMETTAMLRLATYEPAAEQVFDLLGFRGLPLKEPFELRPHQIKALTWMRAREVMEPSKIHGLRGGVIMLTQGLGKTITALSMILTSPRGEFPSLVVASKTVMHEWQTEGVQKFLGNNVKVLYLHNDFIGKVNIAKLTRKEICTYEIVITTYDVLLMACKNTNYREQTYEMGEDNTLMKGKKAAIHHRTKEQCNRPKVKGIGILYCTPWERIICDESQRFANWKTTIYECVMALYGERMWCLSGTPIKNYCFTGDTRVVTNQGNIQIRNLVRYKQKSSLRILSYNKQIDEFEYKKMEKGWELEAEEGLVTITMGKKKITCTPDHKILVTKGNPPAEPFYIEAQKLKLGSYVIHYGEKDFRTCAMNILNYDQEQVVIGSYLGDGHLRVLDYYRTSLEECHSKKQKGYSKWKADLFQVGIKERMQTAPGYTDRKVYYFNTTSFYFPYEGIQNNKTSIPQSIIDKIEDLALLVWYLDDGNINEAGNLIELATCSFDRDTHERLCIKLKSMGIDCKITKKYNRKQDKYYPTITLGVLGVKALISRIYKFDIPSCMRYKINSKPLLKQIEDSNRPLKDIFWNKHHIPLEKRKKGMIIKERTAGGKKIGTFKWDTCLKCKKTSFLCRRSDSGNYRCMMCRSQSTGIHMDRTLYKITNECYTLSNKFGRTYQIHPVTNIEFLDNPKDKKVFDIQVQDNHNFVIGSINEDIKYGPVVSNCTDIWSQMRFCGYTGVTQAIEWRRNHSTSYMQHRLNEAIFSMDYKDAQIVLPPKTEYFINVALTGNHKIFYEWVLGQTIIAYDDMMKGYLDFACVLAWFTALRQVAIAPYLFTAQSKRSKATGKAKKHKEEMMAKIKKQFANSEMYKWLIDKTTDSGIRSSKISEIVKIISRIPKGEKILIFSNFTSCTDLVADAIKESLPKYKYVQVDGDVTGKDRSAMLEKFKTDPKVQGLLMTYRVGSEGLNLTQATHCICVEPWWTDAVHRQAKARCYRMGQTKEVHIHNIYVENTIEEKVNDICKSKNEMSDSFLEGTEKPLKKNAGLTKATLGKILGIR